MWVDSGLRPLSAGCEFGRLALTQTPKVAASEGFKGLTVEVLKRLASYHSWGWDSLGGSALLRVFALIRKVLPAATEDTALGHLSQRSPLNFQSFLHRGENLGIVGNVLEGDDRKDAKAEKDYGHMQKMVVAQLAWVATMVANKHPGSKIANTILKVAEDVGEKLAPAETVTTSKERTSQFDPRVQDCKQDLPDMRAAGFRRWRLGGCTMRSILGPSPRARTRRLGARTPLSVSCESARCTSVGSGLGSPMRKRQGSRSSIPWNGLRRRVAQALNAERTGVASVLLALCR